MQIMKNIDKNVKKAQNIVDTNIVLKFIMPIGVMVLIAFYYFPFYGLDQLIKDNIWADMYDIVNPFSVAPFALGILSIVVSIVNRNVFMKILFFIFYFLAFGISLIGLMGAIYTRDFLIYFPHVIIVLAHLFIWIRYKSVKK